MTPPHDSVRLTKFQKLALRWTLRDGEVNEYFLFEYGGGTDGWRTFRSLAAKGLVERVCWEELSSDERGYVWKLSADGYRLACELAEIEGWPVA